MQPSISIDERGVLLHVVGDDGHGFAVPLNAETMTELGSQIAVALERLKAPEERGRIFWRLGRAIVKELLGPEGAHGTPEPDSDRKKDSK